LKMQMSGMYKRILRELNEKKSGYLISFYGGFGLFLGATLSDYYGSSVLGDPSSRGSILGTLANLVFGVLTFVLLAVVLGSIYKPLKDSSRPFHVLAIMMLIAASYALIGRNPGVIPWIGSHGVLVSLVTALLFHAPIDTTLSTEIEKAKSNRKRALLIDFLKTKRGDYVKYIDLAILGTVALLTIAAAALATGMQRVNELHAYFEFSLVYGVWFAYNFIGVILGIICQLFQKLEKIDDAITKMLRSTT